MDLELVCLGVGAGKCAVYDGYVSSSFLLRVGPPQAFDSTERPPISAHKGVLLVDCGFGVTRACLRHVPSLPELLFVSHNHTDHAGELPVVLAVERTRQGGGRRTVLAEEQVARVLRERRLYETTPMGAFDADWINLRVGQITPIGRGLAMEAVGPCRHAELCFGFLLYLDEGTQACGTPSGVSESQDVLHRRYRPLFGFTGDSGFSEELMSKLATAPLLLADGREVGTSEHAAFSELDAWRQKANYKGRLVIYHYGASSNAPDISGLEVAKPGEAVARWHISESAFDGPCKAAQEGSSDKAVCTHRSNSASVTSAVKRQRIAISEQDGSDDLART